MSQQQMSSSYATEKPHAQITQHVSMAGSAPVYVVHMNSLASTIWPGVLYIGNNDAGQWWWLWCHSPNNI